MLAFLLSFAAILTNKLMAMNSTNSSMCVFKGQFGDIRGPYKHIIFNDSLNGNIYQFSRPNYRENQTLYLYPHIISQSYYWLIGKTLYSSFTFTYCYIGDDLGPNYLFDINDCQWWAFHNSTADEWQITNADVSLCQWNDICIEDAIYLPYMNTNFRFDHWNYSANGAVYYNEMIDKYIYPHRINNGTYAQYIMHGETGNSMANAYCNIGTRKWWYSFNINDCFRWRSYYQLEWHIESNLTITNCSTSTPTIAPTEQPTINPTELPSINPTVFPTQQPTIFPTKQPTIFPTEQPTIYPTEQPTIYSTEQPTIFPTEQPTIYPTELESSTQYIQSGLLYTTKDISVSNNELIIDRTVMYTVIGGVVFLVLLLIILIGIFCCVYHKKNKEEPTPGEDITRQRRVETDSTSIETMSKQQMKIFIAKTMDDIQKTLEMQQMSNEGNKSETDENGKECEGVAETAEI